MLWDRIAARWEELVDDAHDRWTELSCEDMRAIRGDHALFVTIVHQRTGMTEEEAATQIASWAEDLAEINLVPLSEATHHAGRDDVHEQRERDQESEGMLRWPPHVGTLHARGR